MVCIRAAGKGIQVRIELVSYNVHGCVGWDGRVDPGRVAAVLSEVGGDVVALQEVPRLERRLDLLATIAQLAPLLGLLGTVLGFIKTFITLQGQALYANSAMMSEGTGQALICTAAGLAVAIPIHAGYNYLVSRVNAIVTDMERAANEIVNIVTENGRSKSA